MPSFLSSDPAQTANSEASSSKPSETLASSPLFTASIENLTPRGALEMIWLRMASARGIRLELGTISFTKPIRYAS